VHVESGTCSLLSLCEFHVDSSWSFVSILDLEFDVVTCAGVNKALNVTDVDEDVVRLILDFDKAKAAVVKPASNRSLHLDFSPHCGLSRKRSEYRTKRRGITRFRSGFVDYVLCSARKKRGMLSQDCGSLRSPFKVSVFPRALALASYARLLKLDFL